MQVFGGGKWEREMAEMGRRTWSGNAHKHPNPPTPGCRRPTPRQPHDSNIHAMAGREMSFVTDNNCRAWGSGRPDVTGIVTKAAGMGRNEAGMAVAWDGMPGYSGD